MNISDLWEEIKIIPHPVTGQQVLEVARQFAIKAGKDFKQFEAWFDTEKAHVLAMLNGSP